LTRLDLDELALDLAQHPAELDPASAQLRESPGKCLANLPGRRGQSDLDAADLLEHPAHDRRAGRNCDGYSPSQ
jgi:hypothetical protein